MMNCQYIIRLSIFHYSNCTKTFCPSVPTAFSMHFQIQRKFWLTSTFILLNKTNGRCRNRKGYQDHDSQIENSIFKDQVSFFQILIKFFFSWPNFVCKHKIYIILITEWEFQDSDWFIHSIESGINSYSQTPDWYLCGTNNV